MEKIEKKNLHEGRLNSFFLKKSIYDDVRLQIKPGPI